MAANITRELQNAPLPQMVKSLGLGIAEAQFALDKVSMKMAQEMIDSKIELGDKSYSLLALGFTPTFYQYVDTLLELKVAFSMTESKEIGASAGLSAGIGIVGASVSASYSQKYQYSAEGSSSVKTQLVTIPTPQVFEQRLRSLVEQETQDT